MARGRPKNDGSVDADEIMKLAVIEDISVPDGVEDVKGYVLSEMDNRLNAARAVGNGSDIDKPDMGITHPSQKVEIVPEPLKVDVVRSALAKHIAAGMMFDVDDAGVWTMKKGIKEDCGNLVMPLRAIVTCADMVVSKAFVPRSERDGKEIILMT